MRRASTRLGWAATAAMLLALSMPAAAGATPFSFTFGAGRRYSNAAALGAEQAKFNYIAAAWRFARSSAFSASIRPFRLAAANRPCLGPRPRFVLKVRQQKTPL